MKSVSCLLKTAALYAFMAFAYVQPVYCQNAVTPETFRVNPATPHCLGFIWNITGDTNLNASVNVQYRQTGSAQWKNALDMMRQDGQDMIGGDWQVSNMFSGSILNLAPGTRYECKFHMADADNGIAWSKDTMVAITTNTYPPVFTGGRIVHVYASTYAGTKLAPYYATVQAAASAATAGTVILIHAGIHAGTVFTQSIAGAEGAPIVFRGAGDGEAILDGGSSAPTEATASLFEIRYSKYVTIENLTLRNCGRSIAAVGIEGLIVRNCTMYNVYSGILLGSGSSQAKNCFIMNNRIKGVFAWRPYWNPPNDPTGVVACGRNIVVCFNTISNLWDGITPGYPGVPADKNNPSMVSLDFYSNYIYQVIDDCIETDYSASNVRVWNNLLMNGAHGISCQPVLGGPIYLFRNFVFNFSTGPLKFHNLPSGIEVYNNTFNAGKWGSTAGWMNVTMKNNVWLGFSTNDPPAYILRTGSADPRTFWDYNGYLDTLNNYGTFIGWIATLGGVGGHFFSTLAQFYTFSSQYFNKGFEQHGALVKHTDFVNMFDQKADSLYDSAAVDFRIASATARPVDKGCIIPTITDTYNGSAPDLGAIEYGADYPHFGVYRGNELPMAISGVPANQKNKSADIKGRFTFSGFLHALPRLPDNERYQLAVFDLQGRRVLPAGSDNRQNRKGIAATMVNAKKAMPNGVYLIRLSAAHQQFDFMVLNVQ